MLTTSTDTFVGTDANELVTGVTSSLSSEKTLTSADIIDGAAGTDTLKVSMKSAFTGFTGDGKMENVEIVELTNDSTIGRIFDATGITGVEKYVVDAKGGDVELKDLNAAGITVDYSGAKASAVKVAFDADFVTAAGTADEMTLKVADLGTAAVADTAKTAAVAAKYAAVTMANIENVNVESAGTANLLDLTAVSNAKTINVSGAADLTISAVSSTVTKVDASAATGKLNLDLKAATGLNNVATGSGDDSITIDTANILANAEINGGDGDDTLVVTSATKKTLQLSMSDVETVSVSDALTADVILSNTNTSGLANVDVTGNLGSKLQLVNLAAADMTVNGKGNQSALGTGEVYMDNSGATTVNLSAAAAAVKAKQATSNDLKVSASETADLTVNVGSYVESLSTITANKAATVVLNVASGKNSTSEVTEFQGTINAAKAETITVNATGNLGVVAGAATIKAETATSANITTTTASNKLILDAEKLETLEITAAKGLTFDAASDLTAVQMLNATTGDALTLTALEAAANVTIAGTQTASKATIDSIGKSGLEYDTTLTATGLASGLKVSNGITSKANINVDVTGVTGKVELNGNITAGSTVTIDADGLGGNLALGGTIKGKNVIINAKTALGNVSTDGTTATTADSTVTPVILSTAVEITATESVTYNGTNLAANAADISMDTGSTVFTAELNGGLEKDDFIINTITTLTNLTVTGDLGMGTNKLTIVDSAITAAAKIDISALAGYSATTTTEIDLSSATAAGHLTIVGSDFADTITGGAGNDTITGGKGKDTLTGGAGADEFVFAAGDSGLTTATVDKITDFKNTGADKLKLGVAGSATNFDILDTNTESTDPVTTTNQIDTVEKAIAAANAAKAAGKAESFDGTIQYLYVIDSVIADGATANSYLVIDSNLDGTADMAIDLTGIATAGLVADDIIA